MFKKIQKQYDPWLNLFKYIGLFSLISLFLTILFSSKFIKKIQTPQFHITSISFSPSINHHGSKNIIDWNITLSIKNPNEGSIIFMYEEIRAWIYRMDDLFSVYKLVDPIIQSPKEKILLVPIRLSTYDHDGWLSKEIEEDFAIGKEVAFDFLLQSRFYVSNKLRIFKKRVILGVYCNDLRLDLFNRTNGIMHGDGGNCTQEIFY